MNVCITTAILSISYTTCCFLCACHASNTFFYKISSQFSKKCSPPSVESIIMKAAHMQNHETYASCAPQFGPCAPFLHHLLQPEICKIHWNNVYFLFMAPSGKLYLASSALSHGSKLNFLLFRIAFSLIVWKNARRHRWERSKSTPFRYSSFQCKPSWSRPHAVAVHRLHDCFRRSETLCRA